MIKVGIANKYEIEKKLKKFRVNVKIKINNPKYFILILLKKYL